MRRFKPIGLDRRAIDRFWSKVSKSTGCWLWSGTLQQKGYGTLMVDNERHSVHRIAWTLHFGPIPHRLMVCHSCDVPSCVNPNHLFLGTNSDNMRDAAQKHRLHAQRHPDLYRGDRNMRATVTAEIVLAIRAQKGRRSMRALAMEYGVSRSAICHIQQRRVWAHIP